MEVKDYLSFAGLAQFLANLKNTFSFAGHKHSKEDIEGVRDFVVTDDGEGNVYMELPTAAALITSEDDILTVDEDSN